MSDLSNLLGDVYGDSSNPDGPPVRHEAPAAERLPEWSEDSRLDRAFADWQPESHGGGGFDAAVKSPAADSALADALSAALAPAPAPVVSEIPAPLPVAAAPAAAPAKPAWTTAPTVAPAAVAAPAPVRMWAPGDDDIFPARGRKR